MKTRSITYWLISTTIILPASIFSFAQCKQPETGISVEHFVNPPVESRPLAYWAWLNGYIDSAKMVYELEQMKEKGMQGAFIWDVGAMIDPDKIVPAGPAFLGDESLEHISLALKTAERLGINLGLITSSSWNAGGPWIEEADASMQLLSTRHVVKGPSNEPITIGTPGSQGGDAKKYSLITTMAIPHVDNKVIDHLSVEPVILDDYIVNDNVIQWEVPEGEWDILSFFMANTMQNLYVPSPNSNGLIIDHLSKRATRNHFDTIISRLEKASTPERRIKFLEVDSYEVWSAKDWTPGFIEEFRSHYGYDPVPFLPLLVNYTNHDSIVGERFLGDYRRLVSDLIIKNHFAQGSEISEKHNMLLFAEGGHGGHPRVDPLKAMGQVHVPMGEFWNRQRHWVTKEASSAANIYGKKVVASESLTGWNHWQHGPTDFKQLCDVAFCVGLNQLVFHTFSHNPEIAGKPGFAFHAGEHVNVNASWWEMSKPFMYYLSRSSYMLRQGNFVADVLLYYGDDAPNLVPTKRMDPNYTPDMPGLYPHWFDDDTKCPHCGMPKPVNPGRLHGYDYDYINADVITTTLKCENGRLALPHGQSYKVMMIPDREDISLEVLKSLEKLVNDGAVIVGPKPSRATSLKNYPESDLEVKAIADKLWGNSVGNTIGSNNYGKGTVYWGETLDEVLEMLGVAPDFEVIGIDNCDRQIDYFHRQTETENIYFVSNSSRSKQHYTAVFRVDGNRVPEIWDPETGLIQRHVEYAKVENGISIEFIMDPLAARFVVFTTRSSGKNDQGLDYDLQFGFHNAQNGAPSINLSTGWQVGFDPNMGGPEQYFMEDLVSWTDTDVDGIRFYSGKATYTREFTVDAGTLDNGEEAFVVFENIKEMARVFVNGNNCGIVWTPPYQANITPYLKPGTNKITVEVVNVWNNRIVGDLRNPDQKQYTKTNVKTSRFSANQPLIQSGLLGKAEVIFLK